MTDDFELRGRLRARRLRAHSPPEPETTAESAELERDERRRGAEKPFRPEQEYRDVEIEKRLRGRTR